MIIYTHDDIVKQKERYLRMTETPINRLVLTLAVPTIISMCVSAMYNMADSYFVGHINTESTAAVGMAFAFQALIQAIGFFFGSGSGNYISRALGAQDTEGAEKMAATGFLTAFLFGLAIMVIGLSFLTPFSRLLGATPDVIPYSNAYLKWLLIAAPFLISQMALNNQLRLQGNANLAMIGLVSGALLNILLDWIFICKVGMGVSGASLATLISQFVSWLLLLWVTTFDGNVHIKIGNFSPTRERYREVAAGGLPSLMRQSLSSISSVCLNWAAAIYAVQGHEASTIAAFAVVARVMQCAMAVILGFGQGFQPVCGFNWGAKKYARVRQSYLFAMAVTSATILVLATLGYIFAPQVIAFFRDEDPELIRVGARVLRWQCIAFPLVGVTTPTNMLLQNIRRTGRATMLAMSRQGIFFYPALFLAPHFWGLDGLQATMAIADVCTFMLALPFCISILRELKNLSTFEPC
ncbi:MAG: MATE family efflux transporter [Bacteroidaceae bacterium]|nr:MATE family efflux transporter [Bacteroidaceae bacterium]